MKLTKQMLAHYRCAYLYATDADGKLVIWHSQTHKLAGKVEWATVHDTGIKCSFQGRIVLHRRAVMRLVAQATRVSAKTISHDNGSEASKARNIPVGSVSLTIGEDQYQDTVYFNVFDFISSDFTYQPDNVWKDPEHGRFDDLQIAA